MEKQICDGWSIGQAMLNLQPLPANWTWFGGSAECVDCYLEEVEPLWGAREDGSGVARCAIVHANFPYYLEARDVLLGSGIKRTLHLGERGDYNVTLSAHVDDASAAIEVATVKDPMTAFDIYAPIITLILAPIFAKALWVAAWRAWATFRYRRATALTECAIRTGGGGGGVGLQGLADLTGIADLDQPEDGVYKPLPTENAEAGGWTPLSVGAARGEPALDGSGTAAAANTAALVNAKPRNAGGGKRLGSLDTFRGISLSCMIFVNGGAGCGDTCARALCQVPVNPPAWALVFFFSSARACVCLCVPMPLNLA